MLEQSGEGIYVKPGVYIVYDEDVPIYVGTSIQLKVRVRHHPYRSIFLKRKCKVVFLKIDGAELRHQIERLLIDALQPELNKLGKARNV